jgi:hypothetical protein
MPVVEFPTQPHCPRCPCAGFNQLQGYLAWTYKRLSPADQLAFEALVAADEDFAAAIAVFAAATPEGGSIVRPARSG